MLHFPELGCWCHQRQAKPLAGPLQQVKPAQCWEGIVMAVRGGSPFQAGNGMQECSPEQVCAHACMRARAREKPQPPGLPQAPGPYIAIPMLPEPGSEPGAPPTVHSRALAGPGLTPRIVLSSQQESAVGLGCLPFSVARNISMLFAKSIGSWQASLWPILN